jgi:hypothetical protein
MIRNILYLRIDVYLVAVSPLPGSFCSEINKKCHFMDGSLAFTTINYLRVREMVSLPDQVPGLRVRLLDSPPRGVAEFDVEDWPRILKGWTLASQYRRSIAVIDCE